MDCRRLFRHLLSVSLWLAAGIGVAVAAPLAVIVDDGVRRFDATELAAAHGEVRLVVHEPHEDRARGYVGIWARDLLDAAFGQAWQQAGAVVFECADGYRALIAPEKLVASRALLAWASADAEPFTLVNRLQGDEQVDLEPFYLVWDNREDTALREAGASDWPYQVVGISVLAEEAVMAHARPPAQADDASWRGFHAFAAHCATCHRVNGDGGDKGPELNRPVSVTEYLAPGWLQRWMLAPETIRPGTTMPGLPQHLPDRIAVADDIEHYLRTMAAAR